MTSGSDPTPGKALALVSFKMFYLISVPATAPTSKEAPAGTPVPALPDGETPAPVVTIGIVLTADPTPGKVPALVASKSIAPAVELEVAPAAPGTASACTLTAGKSSATPAGKTPVPTTTPTSAEAPVGAPVPYPFPYIGIFVGTPAPTPGLYWLTVSPPSCPIVDLNMTINVEKNIMVTEIDLMIALNWRISLYTRFG
uniref:Uncharacterized protein n=1 Tax=Tetranychus urticae TaxID=32264 RepID=T1KRM0_TETUR